MLICTVSMLFFEVFVLHVGFIGMILLDMLYLRNAELDVG